MKQSSPEVLKMVAKQLRNWVGSPIRIEYLQEGGAEGAYTVTFGMQPVHQLTFCSRHDLVANLTSTWASCGRTWFDTLGRALKAPTTAPGDYWRHPKFIELIAERLLTLVEGSGRLVESASSWTYVIFPADHSALSMAA